MTNRTHNISQEFVAACKLLDIDPERVLRQSGLERFLGKTETLLVTSKELAAVYAALATEYGQDDCHIRLANGFAQGAFGNAFLAMQSSETLRDGIHRAGRFKELFEPIRWTVLETDTSFSVSACSLTREFPFGGFMQIICFLWLVQSARHVTAKHIVPNRVYITEEVIRQAEIEQQIGCPITVADRSLIEFSPQLMDTPILSANQYITHGLDVIARTTQRSGVSDQGFVDTVYRQVLELLPSGVVTSERIAKRLSISKRTLERGLVQHGKSFSEVVRHCRMRMADHYLRQESLPISEIAYLVGYRETNSFYRAFKSWHGCTPQDARKQTVNGATWSSPEPIRFSTNDNTIKLANSARHV